MNEYFLSHGPHGTGEDGRCAMEWVSYLAGEPHSDTPVCVSPLLTKFCIALNDRFPDDQRQRLRPYLARTIGTRGDGLDERRSWLCADWLIREYTPAWLELVPTLVADAERLRSLPPVLAVEGVESAMADLSRARSNAVAAGNAARTAAWAAARTAAWDAARAAARGAAAGAAAPAGDAAGAAATAAAAAAAEAAAGNAAGAAARDAVALTVTALQDSILRPGGLLDRMLPTELIQLPVVGEWREICTL